MENFAIDHIDPINGNLVCGLCKETNEVVSDASYNCRKNNRFVPYRVCEHPAPTLFGDTGEFLVEGEWTVCEFGGTEWWEESNRVGNSQIEGGRKNAPLLNSHQNTKENRKRIGRKTWKEMNLSPNTLRARKENAKAMDSHPNTAEARKKNGRESSVGTQLWMSIWDGFISNASGVSRHNKSLGWDSKDRVKVTHEIRHNYT